MAALQGILIVSIEQAVAAPLCTARLLDAGARVIKIERAEGDFARGYDTAAKGDSSYFAWLNQGKESVCLDFKDETDATLLKNILKNADVLVQNLSPGALERAGFSTDFLHKLNDQLIVCNISGYGTQGEASKKRAYDLLVQAESGLVSVSGSEEGLGRIGVSVCDIGAGVTSYAAILEAIIERSQTGKGSEVSISLFDVAAEWMTVPYMHAEFGEGAPKPVGLKHPSIAPYGAFECKDNRLVLISIQNEREWKRLCSDVLLSDALVENPLFSSNNLRVENRTELEKQMNAITTALTAEEFQSRLQQANIAYGAINSANELRPHPAFRSREVGNSSGERYSIPAHPVLKTGDAHISATKSSIPGIGEHTDLIKREFDSE